MYSDGVCYNLVMSMNDLLIFKYKIVVTLKVSGYILSQICERLKKVQVIAEDKSALSVSVYFLLATQMIPPCQRKISYISPPVPKTSQLPNPPHTFVSSCPFPRSYVLGADSSNGATELQPADLQLRILLGSCCQQFA